MVIQPLMPGVESDDHILCFLEEQHEREMVGLAPRPPSLAALAYGAGEEGYVRLSAENKMRIREHELLERRFLEREKNRTRQAWEKPENLFKRLKQAYEAYRVTLAKNGHQWLMETQTLAIEPGTGSLVVVGVGENGALRPERFVDLGFEAEAEFRLFPETPAIHRVDPTSLRFLDDLRAETERAMESEPATTNISQE